MFNGARKVPYAGPFDKEDVVKWIAGQVRREVQVLQDMEAIHRFLRTNQTQVLLLLSSKDGEISQ